MAGHGGETDDEDDPEATVPGEAGKGAVVEVGALKLCGFAAEGIEESKPGSDCGGISKSDGRLDTEKKRTYPLPRRCRQRQWRNLSTDPIPDRTAMQRFRGQTAEGRR